MTVVTVRPRDVPSAVSVCSRRGAGFNRTLIPAEEVRPVFRGSDPGRLLSIMHSSYMSNKHGQR